MLRCNELPAVTQPASPLSLLHVGFDAMCDLCAALFCKQSHLRMAKHVPCSLMLYMLIQLGSELAVSFDSLIVVSDRVKRFNRQFWDNIQVPHITS